jgi:integrase
MASLQARHARSCSTGKPWTPFDRATMDGCDCGPSFYVVVREGRKLHRERVGKDRQTAERALRKVGTQVDDGGYTPQKKIRFDAWADQWLAGLETKSSTRRSYGYTIELAKASLGDKVVRRLTVDDVKGFATDLRDRERAAAVNGEKVMRSISDSTRAKHLRVLGICLGSAVVSGYAARNPAREIPKGERPRAQQRESAYFTADEVPVLFAEIDEGCYRVMFLAALKTGMRQGELSALTWGDADLGGGVIHVRRSWTEQELTTPKNHERRDVDITEDLVELLGGWWGELGKPADDRLVFPAGTVTGYQSDVLIRRELYAAMGRAGIARVGPTGEPRTFHSFRHTFAKRALESGRPITWLSRHLGHSSIDITDRRYGHFERAERKRQAEQMAGVFGV